MLNLLRLAVGPLAGPECRRALARGWPILLRGFSAAAALGVTATVLWWWWFTAQADPWYQPFFPLRGGLVIVLGMLVTVALVLAPAVLAGSLAGDKERGVLALLLTTSVSSREIVGARYLGKLSQVGMILLAAVPAVVLLASLAGFPAWSILWMLILPASVAVGAGGMATLLSVVSRRGRDALLSAYLLELLFLLFPYLSTLGLPRGLDAVVIAVNPYACLEGLAWEGSNGGAVLTSLLWVAVGLACVAVASWRLRPASLSATSGTGVERKGNRGRWVPAVDERRPMLWKELFIERVGSLGRLGTWIGRLLVAVQLVVTLGTAGYITWTSWGPPNSWNPHTARDTLAAWLGGTGGFFSVLIQCAIGLRAAVSISSERERGTWDALLASPLEPDEIVRSKLWGSLNALRWLIFACLLSWTVGVACDALRLRDAVQWSAEILVIGAFMAAVGVRTSLGSATVTRAMSVTLGTWMVAYVGVVCMAGLMLTTATLLANLGWLILSQTGQATPVVGFWMPVPWVVAWPLAKDLIYLLTTLVIVADTRVRFDRMAGRITGGRVAAAIDAAIYGRPVAPELVAEAGPATASE